MERSLFLENDNPVDFLYLDRQRVSSLIGQLSERGMLTSYKSVLQKSQNLEGTARADALVAKAGAKINHASSESAEETYDPFWTHVHTFLQDLEKNYAVAPEQARLGSLVKFEAFIQFVDLGLMRNLWEPSLLAHLHSQSNAEPSKPTSRRDRKNERRSAQGTPEYLKIGLSVMKEMPHVFHMTFFSTSTESTLGFWASVKPEYLTINSEDMAMKYGAVVSGIWAVVGILDAFQGEPSQPVPVNSTIDAAMATLSYIRQQVGRPDNHFGITPIAIYKPLIGAPEAELSVVPPPEPSSE